MGWGNFKTCLELGDLHLNYKPKLFYSITKVIDLNMVLPLFAVVMPIVQPIKPIKHICDHKYLFNWIKTKKKAQQIHFRLD